MNSKKTKEPFASDSFFTEEIMQLMADTIQNEIEMDILAHEERAIDIPKDFDEKLLRAMRQKDLQRQGNSASHKRDFVKRFCRIAAIFLVCIVSVCSITMVSSEAFRIKVLDWFFNDDVGSVTLRSGDEEELLNGWENFWYPTIVPGNVYLVAAEELDHFLLYSDAGSEREFRIFEQSTQAMISIDTDFSKGERIKIGHSDGYIFEVKDSGRFCATWRTDSLVMMMYFDGEWDKKEILRIVEGLEFVENI